MADVLGYSADTLEFGRLMLLQLDTGQGANALEFEATEIPSSPQREESSAINKLIVLQESVSVRLRIALDHPILFSSWTSQKSLKPLLEGLQIGSMCGSSIPLLSANKGRIKCPSCYIPSKTSVSVEEVGGTTLSCQKKLLSHANWSGIIYIKDTSAEVLCSHSSEGSPSSMLVDELNFDEALRSDSSATSRVEKF
ncbi:hypothetical protein Cgig2_018302 [Carnegiea gigantea]|uniref:Uncharacterized protein n=1 Tax=Carnegiea gigantea TaxID=171969 RepID=A0A9Q1KZC0_9CARY|nr:hypothetical protein Cgig2_018302 [Carnegiea gigantea]